MSADGLERLISTAPILISFSPLVTFLLCFSEATVWDGRMAQKASRRPTPSSCIKLNGSPRLNWCTKRWFPCGLSHNRAKQCVLWLLESTAKVPPGLHNCGLKQTSVRDNPKANVIPKWKLSPFPFAKRRLKMEKALKTCNDFQFEKITREQTRRQIKRKKKRPKAFGQRSS